MTQRRTQELATAGLGLKIAGLLAAGAVLASGVWIAVYEWMKHTGGKTP